MSGCWLNMKIVYSFPHPSHRLGSEEAGHIIRANAMLNAMEMLGHEIIRVEAASGQGASQTATSTYRTVVKKALPRPLAMYLRDMGRVAFSRRYAARLTKVAEEYQPDVILETHIAFSLGGKLASEATGLTLILDDVAPSWEEQQQYGVGSQKLAKNIHQEVTSHASLLVAVSASIRQTLIQDGLPDEKIVTVSNGIDERYFHPEVDGGPIRKKYGINPEAIVIVFVGSFQPYHRVDLLLRAVAAIETQQPPHLLLIGGGQRVNEVKMLAEKLGLASQVTFTGQVPYQEVASHIAAGDIAIMPATNAYGNPMKIYEYMALGKAVIAPDQETIREIAMHNNGIYLFEPMNVDATAAALQAVIEDKALRQQLGRQAIQIAADHTWRKRAETLQAAILNVVAGKTP